MKKWIIPLILCIATLVIAQTTQPVTTVNTKAQARKVELEGAAPVNIVVDNSTTKTIDIVTWPGYHDGGTIRIAVKEIAVVRPHHAGTGTLAFQGCAVDLDWGVYYTTEGYTALTNRLAAKGWGP